MCVLFRRGIRPIVRPRYHLCVNNILNVVFVFAYVVISCDIVQFVAPVSYSEVCQAGPLIDSLHVSPMERARDDTELLVGTSQEGLFVVDPVRQTARDLPLYGPVKLLAVTRHLAVFVGDDVRSRRDLVLIALSDFDPSTQHFDKQRIQTMRLSSDITSVAVCPSFVVRSVVKHFLRM